MITLELDDNTASKLFEFLTEHLEVINDTPEVESIMLELENKLTEECL